MSILSESMKIGRHEAGNLWFKEVMVICGFAGLIILMSVLNAVDARGLVLVMVGVGVLLYTFTLTSPKAIYYALGLGGLVAELNDKDISQGTIKGVTALYRIWLGGIYAYLLLGGLLSAVPFSGHLKDFWVIAIFGGTMAVTALVQGGKTNPWVWRSIYIYCAVMIGLSLWDPLSEHVKEQTGVSLSGTLSSTTKRSESNYVGLANGHYVVHDYERLVIDWPTGTCPRFYPGDGVNVQGFVNIFEVHLQSKAGDREIEIRTLAPGETWKGYTCGQS